MARLPGLLIAVLRLVAKTSASPLTAAAASAARRTCETVRDGVIGRDGRVLPVASAELVGGGYRRSSRAGPWTPILSELRALARCVSNSRADLEVFSQAVFRGPVRVLVLRSPRRPDDRFLFGA